MATITSRRDGRFEVRESVRTAAGPRSRTLVTFRRLTDEVLDVAARRASRPFDRGAIVRRAEALGVPDARHRPAALARELVAELHRGGPLPEAWVATLRAALPARRGRHAAAMPDSIAPAVEWLGVDDAERGQTLRELLRLTDRVPVVRDPGPLRFPRLDSRALVA
jgi:hypothetical protein